MYQAEPQQPQSISVSAAAGAAIRRQRDELAEALVSLEFDQNPKLVERYGQAGREKSLQDSAFHLDYLAAALSFDCPALFVDYVAWTKIVLTQRKVRADDLDFHLQCTAEILRRELVGASGELAADYVDAARLEMPRMPETLASAPDADGSLSVLAQAFFEAVTRGERQTASRLVLEAVAAGTSVRDIYLSVFQASQYQVGSAWQSNRISVAHEHYSTAATVMIMSQLYPHIYATAKKDLRMVAVSVSGDQHDLGARMLADFFELDGWESYYTGANTPHASVLQTLLERRCDLLAVSATIATNLFAVRDLITMVRSHPRCVDVKILVGGMPFIRYPQLSEAVGADGTAVDATEAVTLAHSMLGAREVPTSVD